MKIEIFFGVEFAVWLFRRSCGLKDSKLEGFKGVNVV